MRMNYWQKRATELENRTYNQSKKNYKQIEEAFNKAQAKINEKIEKWYIRLAENNNIDIADAKRFLNESELKEFKWTLDEYIEHGRENAIDQRWMKELENASAKYHITKLNAELMEIRAEYEKAFAKENQVVEETIKESYTDRYDHTAYEIQRGYGVGFKVAGIDSEQLDKAIKKPWASDGKNFSDRIWSKKTQMVDTLHGELIRSMLTGGNTKEAISIMQKYVRNDVKNAKYAAARLIRTESAYFASEGQKKCFNDLDVEKYEIVATLDNRTSDICQGMDGQVFKMSEFKTGVTAPPFHVNCRSTTAPYFDDEFATGERFARDNDKTYKIPYNITYKEWKNGDYRTDEPFYEVTKTWLDNEKIGIVEDATEYTKNGKTYKVGENGVYNDHSEREKEVADLLAKKLGVNVKLLPTVSGNNRNIRTPDYTLNGVEYDLKGVKKNDKNTLYNKIKDSKGQTKSFIFDILNDSLNIDLIINNIKELYKKNDIRFFNNIFIVKKDKILKIYKRNK